MNEFVYVKTGKEDGIFNKKSGVLSEILLSDLSFLRGDSVFEVMGARKNIVFYRKEHLERLFNSAVQQNLFFLKGLPKEKEEFISFFKEKTRLVTKANNEKESLIRIMITGGFSRDGFNSDHASVFIMSYPFKTPDFDEDGVKLFPVFYQREFPYIKSANYQLSLKTMREHGNIYGDVLYIRDSSWGGQRFDTVLESSKSNFFCVRGGKISTPEKNVLPGITREIVLKIAKEAGYEVKEREVYYKELTNRPFDEVFLTNTTFFVRPVTRIGRQCFEIGSLTRDLWSAYMKHREEYFNNAVDKK